jgi:hypothetical protein
VSASSDAVTSSIFVNLGGGEPCHHHRTVTVAATRVGTLCQPKGALHLHPVMFRHARGGLDRRKRSRAVSGRRSGAD